jgi:hypothetical protein
VSQFTIELAVARNTTHSTGGGLVKDTRHQREVLHMADELVGILSIDGGGIRDIMSAFCSGSRMRPQNPRARFSI